jgi:hypothetical protein
MNQTELRNWLGKAGYPFELSVGRIFRGYGWNTEHARFYSDPVTGKTREIDIVVSRATGTREPPRAVTISFVVECKRSRNKPWIVFSSPETGARLLSADFVSGRMAYYAMLTASVADHPRATFKVDVRVGHSVVRAHSDNKDTDPSAAHSAVQAAITAAAALNGEYEVFDLSQAPQSSIVHAFIPLVVIEGELFEFYLDATNTDVLAPIDRALVVSKSPAIGQGLQAVPIVTASGLLNFVQQATKDTDAITATILDNAQVIVAEMMK